MDTTGGKDLGLLSFIVKYSIESESLGSSFELKEAMLLVLYTNDAVISSTKLMWHEGSHSERNFHSLSANISHHGIAIE